MLNYEPSVGEINNQPSMTVPDQALSLKEILRRYASGQPLDGMREGWFDDENDLPDLNTLDFADREDLLAEMRAKVESLRQELAASAERTGEP